MKFIVSGKNLDVTKALKEKVEKKIGKLSKFFNSDTEVHVTMSTEKNNHIIEVSIASNGTIIRAVEKNDDMYASIDKIVDTLETQIVKNKKKIDKKGKGAGSKGGLNVAESDDKEGFKIVESKAYSEKPMTVEEAVMQMNLGNDELFVFHNFDTKKVNVLYRLNGNKYGIIEPES